MANFVNQTTLPVEKGYPERFSLADDLTDWNVGVPGYVPDINPGVDLAIERLNLKDVNVTDEKSLRELAKLPMTEAIDAYGPAITKVRNPLGRTGINGTGIYYVAGGSRVADMTVRRTNNGGEHEIAMMHRGNKWRFAGGFMDEVDRDNLELTALRELYEEVGLDFQDLAGTGQIVALRQEEVKPRSARATDMGFMTNAVYMYHLENYDYGNEIRPNDGEADQVGWFDMRAVQEFRDKKLISDDHFDYSLQALLY